MRIISANLNGIRSASTKGFFNWLATTDADIVCIQEIKAQLIDLSDEMQNPAGYHGYFYPAEKKGYSGVGIYSKVPADKVLYGLHHTDSAHEFNREGRYIQADWGQLSVISVYFPSGSSSDERQQAKFRFLAMIRPHLDALQASGRSIVLCGDINIAHENIDLKNWKGNLKNSGFLPEERTWLTDLFTTGWVDVYRRLYPDAAHYTWWSNRGQAYAKDVGWRIDYQIATNSFAETAKTASIYKDEKFSDHAPLVVDYHCADKL